METITKFTQLRNLVKKIHESVAKDYLRHNWRDYSHEDIVQCDCGLFAHVNDTIEIEEDGTIYHETEDRDCYEYDEISQCYIHENDAVCVDDIRSTFFTHYNNANGRNEIYEVNDIYMTLGAMDHRGYVFMYNGDIAHQEDVYYWESDGEYHYDREDEDEFIHSYSYKPDAKFFRNKNELLPLYFGIELEVENELNNYSKNEMAEDITTDYLYCKNDGSLSDGFEIVTHPMTFDYINTNKDKFVEMLNNLQNSGFRSYNSTTCGMHIHLSKHNFGGWHLYRFLKFFQDNKDFIIAISQRKIENLQRWANLEDETNDSLIYKAKKKCGNVSRYTAVNLSNSNTIELRIFRGTLNVNSFFKNIEFAQALYLFSRDYANECMNVIDFKKFIASDSRFQNLNKFINLKKI